MKRLYNVIFVVLALIGITALSAEAQSFSDNFNRPDGSVGNGWSTFNGSVLSGGQLETFGLIDVGGGVGRSLPVTFPLTFSFDFRTGTPVQYGGWIIGFNATSVQLPFAGLGGKAEFALYHNAGALPLGYAYQTSSGEVDAEIPVVAGQKNYDSSTLAHISGTVNGDLSASVTIVYGDGTQVSLSTPTPAGAITTAPGSFIVLGNISLAYGPHYIDNFTVAEVHTPLYNVCPLYDSSKAVKSGATIPIKLELCDASGSDLSSMGLALVATSITKISSVISSEVQDSGNANPDSNFRYDSTLGATGGYIFNLSTKGLATGTYNLNFTVTGDPFVYATPFQVK